MSKSYLFDFSSAKVLKANQKRTVYLAQSQNLSNTPPEYFIVKSYNQPDPPEECKVQKFLISSFQDTASIVDIFMSDNKFYIIQKCLESGDLQNYLSYLNGNQLDLQIAVSYCFQLTEQIAKMHSLGIVHRDIKPLNVYLTRDLLTLKFWDFGEACWESDLNRLKIPTGTLSYMSPEMIEKYIEKKDLTLNPYREDIWALGKTFFEIFMSRLCPETWNLSVNELHDYIDSCFEEKEFGIHIASLLKKMMCSENLFFSAKVVSSELCRLSYMIDLEMSKDLSRINEDTESEANLEQSLADKTNEIELSKEGKIIISQEDSNDFNYDSNIASEFNEPEIGKINKFPRNYKLIDQNEKFQKSEGNENLNIDKQKFIFGQSKERKYHNINSQIGSNITCQESTSDISKRQSNKVIKRQNTCYYCRDNKKLPDIKLPCGHSYHKNCIHEMYGKTIIKLISENEKLECKNCSGIISYEFLKKNRIFEREISSYGDLGDRDMNELNSSLSERLSSDKIEIDEIHHRVSIS